MDVAVDVSVDVAADAAAVRPGQEGPVGKKQDRELGWSVTLGG